MKLRRATSEDAPRIAELEQQLFGATAWSPAMVLDELTADYRSYVVAELEGRVEGYAGVLVVSIEADVQTIAVTNQLQGKRAGTALLRWLIDEATQKSATEMFLEVRDDNERAIALYEREGFQAIARRAGYYQPENKDAIIMHRVLGGKARTNPSDGDPS